MTFNFFILAKKSINGRNDVYFVVLSLMVGAEITSSTYSFCLFRQTLQRLSKMMFPEHFV